MLILWQELFSAEQVYFLEQVQKLSGASHVTATGKRKATGAAYIHVKLKKINTLFHQFSTYDMENLGFSHRSNYEDTRLL